jgi:predicted SAM-dependent methyltransferase
VDIVQNLEKGIPFHDNHASRLKIIDVFNYFTLEGADRFLAECLRVLRPGGSLFIRMVDLPVACQKIVAGGLTKEWLEVIYHSPDCAEGEFGEGIHRWGYSFDSLKQVLEKAGFVNTTHWGHYNPHEMKIEAWKPNETDAYVPQLPHIL